MKRLILFTLTILSFSIAFAQDNSIAEWNNVMKTLEVTQETFNEVSPNFPIVEDFETNEALAKAIMNWRKKHPSEWESLDETYNISHTHSVVYLGLFTSKEYEELENNKFQSGWIQWIEASKMTDKRLNEVAPHFPQPKEGATAEDMAEYDQQIERWRMLFGHEYEALLNAPELQSMNPHYDGYVELVGIPKFIRALQTDEFPVYEESKDPWFSEVLFELRKQAWYFIFEPNSFKREYGFTPILPEDFDAEAFRAMVIERIELNKQIEEGELEVESDY